MNVEDFKKEQENITSLLSGGYFKECIRLQKAMYDEYLKVGFTEQQAIELLKK